MTSNEFVRPLVKSDPEVLRCTGRTTAMALDFIAQAIRCAGQEIPVYDHWDTRCSRESMVSLVLRMADQLGLKGFEGVVHKQVIRSTWSPHQPIDGAGGR